MTLQLMLLEEKYEQNQWAVAALTTTSTFQIPLWRPSLVQWYFSSVEALERMDGNRGNFRRAEAYTAMKIFDIHLSSRSREIQENSDIGEKWYRSLAVGCFFVALHIRTNGSSDDSIVIDDESMSVESFLRTCNALDDVTSIEDFTTMLGSIRETLRPFVRFRSEGTPLVSTDFFGELKDHLVASFPRLFQDDTTFFSRAGDLMDRTLGNLWFVSYAPSLNAVATLLVALQILNASREVMEGLLAFYKSKGGNGLTCMQNIIGYIGAQATEQAILNQQGDAMQVQRLQAQNFQLYAQAGAHIQAQGLALPYPQQQQLFAAPLNYLFQRSNSSSISSLSNNNNNNNNNSSNSGSLGGVAVTRDASASSTPRAAQKPSHLVSNTTSSSFNNTSSNQGSGKGSGNGNGNGNSSSSSMMLHQHHHSAGAAARSRPNEGARQGARSRDSSSSNSSHSHDNDTSLDMLWKIMNENHNQESMSLSGGDDSPEEGGQK